jgi:hypothetical protein
VTGLVFPFLMGFVGGVAGVYAYRLWLVVGMRRDLRRMEDER